MENRFRVKALQVSKWKNFIEYIALEKEKRISLADMILIINGKTVLDSIKLSVIQISWIYGELTTNGRNWPGQSI